MIAQQIQDSMELSFNNNNISDYTFAKWNSSAYHTNTKGNLVIYFASGTDTISWPNITAGKIINNRCIINFINLLLKITKNAINFADKMKNGNNGLPSIKTSNEIKLTL